MSRIFLEALPIFLLFVVGCSAVETFPNTLLSDGSVLQVQLANVTDIAPYKRRITIAPSTNATFELINVSTEASFIIFQIHTYQYNVTLSYNKYNMNKVSNESVFGSNIGLLTRQTKNVVSLYVRNDNVKSVEALLVAVAYNDKEPVPGGCNMEFNTEIAPYTKVYMQDVMVFVDVQPASVPFKDTKPPICKNDPVELEIYWMSLTEQDFSVDSYFVGISNMLTVESIMENGQKIEPRNATSWMRRVFSAYTGIGTFYVAVATYKDHSAAYVPAFTYACSPIIDPESCELLPTSFAKFISACCFILGLLSILFGHACIKFNMTLPVLFTGTVFGYGLTDDIGLGLLIGIAVVVVWLICNVSTPIIGNCLFALTLGLLFTSIISLHVSSTFFFRKTMTREAPVNVSGNKAICSRKDQPGREGGLMLYVYRLRNILYFDSFADSFTLVQDDVVYWIAFAFITVCLSLVISLCSFVAHIYVCSIFSSLMVVLPLDYWIGSTLKYIVINVLRRATVKGFDMAIVQLPPLQAKDIIVIVLWVFLAIFHNLAHFCKGGLYSLGTRNNEYTPMDI
ncbi:Transmembrane 7 superfamily member 3, partial [Anthophora retusa]